jgi:site-specific recombinase XerD
MHAGGAWEEIRARLLKVNQIWVPFHDELYLVPDAVRKIVARAGRVAGFTFPVHPHMLRHGCGYRMVNDGDHLAVIQDYLGHRNVHHTRKYTQLSVKKFDKVRRN